MTYRVMTVCTGNICRSPMAEVLLREAFATAGLADVVVESTGVSDEEHGNRMDRRARKVLAAHGLPTHDEHRARQATRADLAAADLVLPMTSYHARALRRMADRSGVEPEIRMYRTFDPEFAGFVGDEDDPRLDVDDPWYGGAREFDRCFAELQAGVPAIVEYVKGQVKAR